MFSIILKDWRCYVYTRLVFTESPSNCLIFQPNRCCGRRQRWLVCYIHVLICILTNRKALCQSNRFHHSKVSVGYLFYISCINDIWGDIKCCISELRCDTTVAFKEFLYTLVFRLCFCFIKIYHMLYYRHLMAYLWFLEDGMKPCFNVLTSAS